MNSSSSADASPSVLWTLAVIVAVAADHRRPTSYSARSPPISRGGKRVALAAYHEAGSHRRSGGTQIGRAWSSAANI